MANNRIVPMPKGFLAVRILQLVFALILIGLTADLIVQTMGFTFSVRQASANFANRTPG